MPKVSMDCPTTGCKKILMVKKNKIGKPTVFCDHCGFQGVVRYAWAVKVWLGEEEAPAEAPAEGEGSHAAPAPAGPASPPAGKKGEPPPVDPKTAPKKKDLWNL